MKKFLRRFLIIILITIAIISIGYTVIKDTEIKNNNEEGNLQASENDNIQNSNNENTNIQNSNSENNPVENKQESETSTNPNTNEANTTNENQPNSTQNEISTNKTTEKTNTVKNKTTKPKDYSKYKSNIEELIKEEENKNVLDTLKSGDNNLIYKTADGSYYEYCFENDKIVNIYYYIECGNKNVAQYMLEAYTTEQMKELYSEANIYKDRAIKAKLSPKMVETYSNYTKEKLMESMTDANNELRR